MHGKRIYISYADPLFPNYRDMFDLRRTKMIFCPGGTSRLTIRSDGSVFPCQYGFCDDKFKMGSVKSQTIEEIWVSSNWELFRGELSIQDLHHCRTCGVSSSCLLKICRLMAYSATGDFFAPPPGCEWAINLLQSDGET
jgi:radical SAM protein with 4Fe4S-binding SPASM domain